MKAGHLRANFDIAREPAGDQEAAVVGAVGADAISAIEESIKTGWLPIALDMAVSRATATVLGSPADRERARESTRRSMKGRLLAPVVDEVDAGARTVRFDFSWTG